MILQSGVQWVLKMILGVLMAALWLVGCLVTQGILRILVLMVSRNLSGEFHIHWMVVVSEVVLCSFRCLEDSHSNCYFTL